MATDDQKEIQRLKKSNKKLIALLRYVRGWLSISGIKRADSVFRIITKMVNEAQDGAPGDKGKRNNSRQPAKKTKKNR